MTDQNNLTRFLEAREHDFDAALQEIKNGRKTGHWMWYIFPQISGLGNSETSRLYAIKDMIEAKQYLGHPVLGPRLVEITSELLNLETNDPAAIFGDIDSLKLKSSMTLFSLLEDASPVFQKVLDKYFGGKKDTNTIRIVKR
ncbi:MAG: DUF1810 domain-containing protein [Chitinophagaceae bacterium]|nr:DUF1810 domain-containing protein [Chitinophagaceae bacterium]